MENNHDQTSVITVNDLDNSISGFPVYQSSVEKAEDDLIWLITAYTLFTWISEDVDLCCCYQTLFVADYLDTRIFCDIVHDYYLQRTHYICMSLFIYRLMKSASR